MFIKKNRKTLLFGTTKRIREKKTCCGMIISNDIFYPQIFQFHVIGNILAKPHQPQ